MGRVYATPVRRRCLTLVWVTEFLLRGEGTRTKTATHQMCELSVWIWRLKGRREALRLMELACISPSIMVGLIMMDTYECAHIRLYIFKTLEHGNFHET